MNWSGGIDPLYELFNRAQLLFRCQVDFVQQNNIGACYLSGDVVSRERDLRHNSQSPEAFSNAVDRMIFFHLLEYDLAEKLVQVRKASMYLLTKDSVNDTNDAIQGNLST